MTVVPRVRLRAGYDISEIIKGGWQLSGDHGTVDSDRAIADMLAFVDAGVTTFDCADIYTGVELMIGRFLAELKRARGAEAAQRVRVHTKYVPDRGDLGRLSLAQIEAAIDRSLQRLGVERLDLVQFHWWDYGVPGHVETMAHLETLRGKGKIELIGVTNFDREHLSELCEVADIASAQVQYSLLDRRVAGRFAETAHQRDVSLLSYGTLAGGFLTDAWLGKSDPGFAFENRSLVKYRLIIEEFGGWALLQDLLVCLRRIADRHEVDVATVAIRSTLDSPDVAAAIVGARYADRLPRTLRAFAIDLTETDRRELDSVLARRIGPTGPVYGAERDAEGPHAGIMKYNLNSGDETELRDQEAKVSQA